MYHADLYDLVTPPSFRGDTEWYRAKARQSGGPVLELGAGSGRITLPIAADGIEVDALEPDHDMLRLLNRKLADAPARVRDLVTVHVADMRAYALSRRFALIIVPFRAFLHNLTDEDRLACLTTARDHLADGGCFAFNVFHPSLEYMAQHAGSSTSTWRRTGTYDRPEGGFVMRSESTRYDTIRQRVDSHHRYEEFGPDGVLTRTFLHRLELAYLYPSDIRRLLKEAGFGRVTIAGGFDGRPFLRDTDELVVEAWLD